MRDGFGVWKETTSKTKDKTNRQHQGDLWVDDG